MVFQVSKGLLYGIIIVIGRIFNDFQGLTVNDDKKSWVTFFFIQRKSSSIRVIFKKSPKNFTLLFLLQQLKIDIFKIQR